MFDADRLTGPTTTAVCIWSAAPRVVTAEHTGMLTRSEREWIAGDIVPPGCYLSAVEILCRQYTAHLLDRAPRGKLPTASTRTM